MNVKKIAVFMLLVVLTIATGNILMSVTIKIKQGENFGIEKMPSFVAKSVKGQILNKDYFSKKDPSVFIAFHPECEHCQYEAKSINEKQTALANTNIVMFTSANDSLTNAFSKTYGLDSLKNVHVLSDSANTMRQLFAIKTMPTVIIYNAQNQLVKRYNGETKIEAILKHIR
jgi:thiol-disulfide isomerase/thioredoxin